MKILQMAKAVASAVAVAVVAAVSKWINLDVNAVTVIVQSLIISGVVFVVPNAKAEIAAEQAASEVPNA